MSRRDLKNVSASVHDRLLSKARVDGRPFNELLRYYGIERFLFRLAQTKHARHFVLKGALLLRSREVEITRLTRDIDLLGYGSNSAGRLAQVVRDCCETGVPDDGMHFDPESVEAREIAGAAIYQGVRIGFRGYLGKARVPMQLDVGFGDAIVPGPILIAYPELLDYGRPRLQGYTLESVVAEKFQAMVNLEMLNTRMKDFYDIWFLARQSGFEGERIAAALQATFERRQTPLPAGPPPALTAEFSESAAKERQWQAFLRKARLQEHVPDLAVVTRHIERFIMPPSEALKAERLFKAKWSPGGPWRPFSGRS